MQIILEPVDTLFFRDGKPFNQGEDHFARGFFPPTPQTFQGVVRSKVLSDRCGCFKIYGKGCLSCPHMGKCTVPEEIGGSFSGAEEGRIEIHGPYLAKKEQGNWVVLYPTPLDWMRLKEKENTPRYFCLEIRKESVNCDLRGLLFPQPPESVSNKEFEPASGLIDEAGFLDYLIGKVEKGKVWSGKDLWDTEYRSGIGRDMSKATTKEGQLYFIKAIRLQEETGLWAKITGLKEDFLPHGFIGIGGEGRASRYIILPDTIENFAADKDIENHIDETGCFKLVLLQPALFALGWLPDGIDQETYQGSLNGIQVRLVSACIGKPVMIGGWDMAANCSKPLLKYVPAGSIYYFEVEKHKGGEVMKKLHGKKIGRQTRIGFGHCVVGGWEYV